MADLKKLARHIFQETLAAIDIPRTMQRKLRREGTRLHCDGKIFDLREFDKLRVVAIGKAAHAMVDGLALVLEPFVRFEGVVSAPTAPRKPLPGMKYFVGGHPIPNEESWKAAESILALLKHCDERTLVFFLLSGGASALVELPLERSLTLEDLQQMNRALVTCGASIEQINAVRKHVSAVKGGRLAVAAGRATKLSLAITDVPPGNGSALASGPTLPDTISVAFVDLILEKYGLLKKFPPRLRQWIENGRMPETPKSDNPCFANAHFLLLLGMDDLFHPAHHAAEARGCVTHCDNSTDDWPVDLAAQFLLEQLENLRTDNPGRRVALIADGEVSSAVTGTGSGIRHLCWRAWRKVRGRGLLCSARGRTGLTETARQREPWRTGRHWRWRARLVLILAVRFSGAMLSRFSLGWTKLSSRDRQGIICATCGF
jgi:hydroxypyruvate reductase